MRPCASYRGGRREKKQPRPQSPGISAGIWDVVTHLEKARRVIGEKFLTYNTVFMSQYSIDFFTENTYFVYACAKLYIILYKFAGDQLTAVVQLRHPVLRGGAGDYAVRQLRQPVTPSAAEIPTSAGPSRPVTSDVTVYINPVSLNSHRREGQPELPFCT